MLASRRSRVTVATIVGALALAGWGLTSAVQKVQVAAARTQAT
jgi:hypothetical protein